ncbi:hypothetical protein Tco_0892877 [Tanacetum coccineum]|uniref:Integrase, catalytic region, zinc finger, CCHC-type, peptidase aspartic, catalytic n=1 Tax=Tanacetum coccineum TaxID=301880 RepID=A0ABQ5C7I3_9ASTR
MANLSEDIQCASSDTRPPMLDRIDFASWQQRIRLYCRGKENGVNILKSIDEGPFQMGTFRETLAEENKGALHLGPERARVYSDLSPEDKDRTLSNGNLIENITNTLALLTQSYKTYLPRTNNQLRTSSNARNQATVQDGMLLFKMFRVDRIEDRGTMQGVQVQQVMGELRTELGMVQVQLVMGELKTKLGMLIHVKQGRLNVTTTMI